MTRDKALTLAREWVDVSSMLAMPEDEIHAALADRIIDVDRRAREEEREACAIVLDRASALAEHDHSLDADDASCDWCAIQDTYECAAARVRARSSSPAGGENPADGRKTSGPQGTDDPKAGDAGEIAPLERRGAFFPLVPCNACQGTGRILGAPPAETAEPTGIGAEAARDAGGADIQRCDICGREIGMCADCVAALVLANRTVPGACHVCRLPDGHHGELCSVGRCPGVPELVVRIRTRSSSPAEGGRSAVAPAAAPIPPTAGDEGSDDGLRR